MNNLKRLLVATFLLFSIGAIHSFEKPTNLGRYTEIVKAFDIDKKVFNQGFASQDGDIQSVEARKESLKKELKSKKITYVTSWMPLLYKVLGTGFGLESIRQFLMGGYVAADQIIDFGPKVLPIIDYPVTALSYMNYPISYPIKKAEGFVQRKVMDKSFYLDAQGFTDWDRYFKARNVFAMASSSGISLATGLIAKYFFNKAASYKNEIDNIEKEIKIDDDMIAALSKKS